MVDHSVDWNILHLFTIQNTATSTYNCMHIRIFKGIVRVFTICILLRDVFTKVQLYVSLWSNIVELWIVDGTMELFM